MAASSSLCNLFSSLTDGSKGSQKTRDGVAPLMAQGGPSAYGPFSSFSSSSTVESVICPSLAYANTLFFKSAYIMQIIVDDNELEERLLNKFKREVMRAGVIQETKRLRYFENKLDEKKSRTRDAAKRNCWCRKGSRVWERPLCARELGLDNKCPVLVLCVDDDWPSSLSIREGGEMAACNFLEQN